MRSPDEIKKGLECCSGRDNACDGCPYANGECSLFSKVATDALVLIQQLEAANAELLTKIKQLEAKCHQLERERDAAVADLAITKECKFCKHFSHAASEEPCRYCGVRQSNWEWRGVKEDSHE